MEFSFYILSNLLILSNIAVSLGEIKPVIKESLLINCNVSTCKRSLAMRFNSNLYNNRA